MKFIGRTLFCITILALMLLCAGCGAVEYSVRDFADVTVVGYTEHGSLSIKVNDAAVNKIYADGRKDKTAALRFAETFRFSYDGQNSDDSFFNNGDVVTVNVTYDESMAKALGVSFVDSSFDYTIEGLEDKARLSPFDGLQVKFSGVAPYGSVQLDKSNCIQYVIDNVTFLCDNHDLSNGDKVVVRAEFNKEIAERNGYVFTDDVKKYTVVGLSKYVTTMMGVDYSPISARMRYMVEQFVEGSETSYKSLNWYFGEESSDTDTDSEEEAVPAESDTEFDEAEDGEGEEGENEVGEEGETSSEGTSSSKKKKDDVRRIKEDMALSDFTTKFEYTPIGCFYALNPLQYSDNVFIAAYKVKGIFVCESTSGSGYINAGDTVVGELYITASLTGGSVDIKNNLVYETTTLENNHAYSIKTFPEYEDMSGDIFKSSTYVVEQLTYVEDQATYDEFSTAQSTYNTRSSAGDAHITIPSNTSSGNSSKKRRSSSQESETDTDTDIEEIDGNESYNDDGEWYGDDYDDGGDDQNDDQNDYENDDGNDYYDEDGGYDYTYDGDENFYY